jgi:hypothetical protein
MKTLKQKLLKQERRLFGRCWNGEFVTTGSEILMVEKNAKKRNKVENTVHMGNNLQYS